jgi:hypothetical protein
MAGGNHGGERKRKPMSRNSRLALCEYPTPLTLPREHQEEIDEIPDDRTTVPVNFF